MNQRTLRWDLLNQVGMWKARIADLIESERIIRNSISELSTRVSEIEKILDEHKEES